MKVNFLMKTDLKTDLFSNFRQLLGVCKKYKTEALSNRREIESVNKENMKLTSINESLKQLNNSTSMEENNQSNAADEYTRLKKKAGESFSQDPETLVKILRKVFKTKSVIFPETELEDIELKYEPGIAEKFTFEPEDCFHGENQDKTLRFRICTKGVIELNGDKVVTKAYVQWEKENQ